MRRCSLRRSRAGAETREGWRLATLTRDSGIWSLRSVSGEELRARLLIAADGVHSTVAQRLKLHQMGRLRKVALVAHIRGIAGLDDYGEMHVANRRYVGLAPLEAPAVGTLCNVAMVVDEARERAKLAGRPQPFLLETLATFPRLHGRLDALEVVRKTIAISRIHVRARHIVGDGLLLVGDAAGYYDPFTGEGIYGALASAKLAAGVAGKALAAGVGGAGGASGVSAGACGALSRQGRRRGDYPVGGATPAADEPCRGATDPPQSDGRYAAGRHGRFPADERGAEPRLSGAAGDIANATRPRIIVRRGKQRLLQLVLPTLTECLVVLATHNRTPSAGLDVAPGRPTDLTSLLRRPGGVRHSPGYRGSGVALWPSLR